jgi:hypothetical protein
LGLSSSGCSTLKDPNAVTTIDGNDKGTRITIMQADRRGIFTFSNKQLAHACAEPSPDVRADIDSAVKALLDASAKTPEGITAAAKAELDSTRKLVTAALIQRSQGLQVLRDMLFQACLANVRGDMSPPQYVNFITVTLPKLTGTLISAEMITRQEQGKPVFIGSDLDRFLNFIILNQ